MDLDQDSKAVGPLTITSNGRRYFGAEHKQRVIDRCLVPGASTAAVALEYGFNANLVRRWVQRHQAKQARADTLNLVPVSVVAARTSESRASRKPAKPRPLQPIAARESARTGLIEIQIGTVTVRLHGSVDPASLRTVLQALGQVR
jgi:transposase